MAVPQTVVKQHKNGAFERDLVEMAWAQAGISDCSLFYSAMSHNRFSNADTSGLISVGE